MARASRVVDDEHPLGGEAAALEQRFDARLERLILQRREAVEERRDERRPRPRHEEHHREPQRPRPHPPPAPGALHEQQRRDDQRSAEQHRERHALGEISQEQRRGGAVEAEAGLEPKRAPQRERQVDQLDERARRWRSRQRRATAAASGVRRHSASIAAMPPPTVSASVSAASTTCRGARSAPWRWCSRPPCACSSRRDAVGERAGHRGAMSATARTCRADSHSSSAVPAMTREDEQRR